TTAMTRNYYTNIRPLYAAMICSALEKQKITQSEKDKLENFIDAFTIKFDHGTFDFSILYRNKMATVIEKIKDELKKPNAYAIIKNKLEEIISDFKKVHSYFQEQKKNND